MLQDGMSMRENAENVSSTKSSIGQLQQSYREIDSVRKRHLGPCQKTNIV